MKLHKVIKDPGLLYEADTWILGKVLSKIQIYEMNFLMFFNRDPVKNGGIGKKYTKAVSDKVNEYR